jgi:hypothetical protein
VRNETSQSKKDDKESYQEEIVISGVPPPIESDIFFLTRGGNFGIGLRYIIPSESFLLQIKGLDLTRKGGEG